MVSEDSQDPGWLPVIHRLRDLRDLDDPRHRQVPTEIHQSDDPGELLEVVSFGSSQWVVLEEWNDHVTEVPEPLHAVPIHVFSVIVVPAVAEHLAAPEETNHVLEDVAARSALGNCELRSHLPPQRHLAASTDRAAEAALPVDKSHDPSNAHEPFLLVFRTRRIVTGHAPTLLRGSDMLGTARYTGFSSI